MVPRPRLGLVPDPGQSGPLTWDHLPASAPPAPLRSGPMTFPQSSAYPEQSQATTILVLGILGIICCGPLGIAAWIMGNNELAAIDAGRRNPEGRSTANAGRIMGIVAAVLMILGVLFFIGALIFGFSFRTMFDTGF